MPRIKAPKLPKLEDVQLDRTDLIFALRKHMRGDQYQKIFMWPTEQIANLYRFYVAK